MSIFVVFHYFFIFLSPRLFKKSLRLGSSTKKLTFCTSLSYQKEAWLAPAQPIPYFGMTSTRNYHPQREQTQQSTIKLYCGVPGLPCLSKSFDSYIDLNFCYPDSVNGIEMRTKGFRHRVLSLPVEVRRALMETPPLWHATVYYW